MRSGSLATLFAALAVFVALFALAGYQVTSETAATRLLGRLAAVIVELDRWLPAHAADLRLEAADATTDTVRPAGFPVSITLPAADVTAADDAALRRLIVDASGAALNGDGLAAFRDAEGRGGSLGLDEPVRWTVALLDDGAHSFWRAALLLALVALLGATAAVLMNGRSPVVPFVFGAAAALAASFAVWLLSLGANEAFTSAVDREIALIVRDGAWIGLRNGLAVAGAALALRLLATRRNDPLRAASPAPPSDAPTP